MNVIILQISFISIILVFFWFLLQHVQNTTTETILVNVQELLESENVEGTTLGEELETTKENTLGWVMLTITLVTIVFGFIISRIILYPARHSLESQKQFISNIAHELRTPLSVLRMNAEIALSEDTTTPRTRKIFRDSIQELDRISEIINNLLSLNTVIRRERIPFENVDLGAVVKKALAKLNELSRKRDTAITIKQSDYAIVWGNAAALEQIALNIIKNAIIYTPESGHIVITVEPDYHGNIVFSVEDTGIGIKRADLFRIFEPFYRSDQSRVRSNTGTGLGLTIVSELVKMHRGKIAMRSALDKGTRIIISLPCGQQDKGKPRSGNESKEPANEISLDFSRYYFPS
jgi:signal transduction histidine kinase